MSLFLIMKQIIALDLPFLCSSDVIFCFVTENQMPLLKFYLNNTGLYRLILQIKGSALKG